MQPEELSTFVDALTEVWKPPFQIVQSVVDYRWTFPINHCPAELQSDEEPPVRLDERAEIIPIDGVV